MKKLMVVWCSLVLFSGCASYSSGFKQIETLMEQEKPKQALEILEKASFSSQDRLLYLLDKAMLQRMAGMYAESNQSFEQAKVLIEDLDGISVMEQAGALSINDSMMSYAGEDFEQVNIHLYAALNYMQLGLWDEARVEALQVDVRLKQLAEGEDDDDKSVYTEDAFSRYLTGVIYEQSEEWSDALIAYRKAYEAYQKYEKSFAVAVPKFLKMDLVRLSQRVGLMDEAAKYQKLFGINTTLDVRQQQPHGEVIMMLHQGLAPIKRAKEAWVSDEEGVKLRISLPEYQSRPSLVQHVRLMVGTQSVDSVVVDDFDAVARFSFAGHQAALIARLLVRAAVKRKAADEAKEHGGGALGLLVNVAGLITETADTRSWLTLPKTIHFARLQLKPGVYPVTMTMFGFQGQVISSQKLADVRIQAGETTLVEKIWVGYPHE